MKNSSTGKSLRDLVIENQDDESPLIISDQQDNVDGDVSMDSTKTESNSLLNDCDEYNQSITAPPVTAVKVTQTIKVKKKAVKVKDSRKRKERSIKEIKPKSNKRIDNKDKDKNHRSNMMTMLLCILCIISLLFATDVVTAAGVRAFFQHLTSSERDIEVKSVTNKDVPIIRGTDSDSIESGRLSTNIANEQERLNQIAEDSRVYCIISSSPYFDSVDSKGAMFISNPSESIYYAQIVIKTKDEDSEMYISPVLAPDEKIEYDYLTNKSFEPGQYPANAYFNYYTKTADGTGEDYIYIGTMCAEVLVVID
jgi:hypothetical protein